MMLFARAAEKMSAVPGPVPTPDKLVGLGQKFWAKIMTIVLWSQRECKAG